MRDYNFYYLIDKSPSPPGFKDCWVTNMAYPKKMTPEEAAELNKVLQEKFVYKQWMCADDVRRELNITEDSQNNRNWPCRTWHHLYHVCMQCGLIG